MNNKKEVAIVGFSAFSGTGKTTLIEKLIPEIKEKGLRIAVLKHDAHDFEIDKEGKDTYRFSKAGADMTVISSKTKTAVIDNRDLEFEEVLSQIHDIDLILVEGYKNKQISRIGICRKETNKGFTDELEKFVAIVSDDDKNLKEEMIQKELHFENIFNIDDTKGIANFIIDNKNSFSKVEISCK